jgi:phenylacetate-CoA ligase
MDLIGHFVKSVTYDLFMRMDGYNLAYYRKVLGKSERSPVDELRILQLERLRSILTWAYEHNRFYADRFRQCGFEPGDLKDFGDLRGLPVLTKADIRNGLGESFSEGFDPSNTIHKRTGGSTGVPLHVYVDWEAVRWKKAATERHDSWAQRLPGCRTAAIWGDTDKRYPLRTRLRNALTDRYIYLDTLSFTQGNLDRFLSMIRRDRPSVLVGHAHSVFRFAEYVRARRADDVSFGAIITTAMVLSPAERMTIEEVFGRCVYDRYGCEELSIIASECGAHSGLHVFAEGVYLEVLGDGSGPGKLILTDLFNKAMPMIRYEVGDYGCLATGSCACGRTLPRIREVSGRTADFLYRPDGVPVFGISILDTFVIHMPGFRQVQIIQDRLDHLDFLIVRDERFTEDSLRILREHVVKIFGTNMRYDVRFVEEIPLTERGKYRFSVCMLDTSRLGSNEGAIVASGPLPHHLPDTSIDQPSGLDLS